MALWAGCGGDDEAADRTERFQPTPLREPAESGRETRSACSLLHPRGLRATSNDSTDLSAYAGDRILRIRAPRRATAVLMARRAFRRLSEPGG